MTVSASAIANVAQAITESRYWFLVGVNVICLVVLTATAVGYQKRRAKGFDIVVSAETIVAFGVTSLILGLVSASYPIVSAGRVPNIASAANVLKIATPFLEGLATAGLAPLFAMFVRNRAAEMQNSDDTVGDTDRLNLAMGRLTAQIEAAAGKTQDLNNKISEATTSLTSLTSSVETNGSSLSTTLKIATDGVKALGERVRESSDELSKLKVETSALRTAFVNTSSMLDTLNKLIESVKRFVEPGTARAKVKR